MRTWSMGFGRASRRGELPRGMISSLRRAPMVLDCRRMKGVRRLHHHHLLHPRCHRSHTTHHRHHPKSPSTLLSPPKTSPTRSSPHPPGSPQGQCASIRSAHATQQNHYTSGPITSPPTRPTVRGARHTRTARRMSV